jgi:hypothetical protein
MTSQWQALETMLPMALMAYLQASFSGQLQDEILLTTSAVIVKLSAQGLWILINSENRWYQNRI